MSDLVTVCLVDLEETPHIYEAPYMSVRVGDEVEVDLHGNCGTVSAVVNILTTSEVYKFALVACGYTVAEGLPRLRGKRTRIIFEYEEAQPE